MNFGSLLTRNISISHFNVRTCILVVSRKVTPHPLSTAAQNTITSFQQTQYFEIFLALAVFFCIRHFFCYFHPGRMHYHNDIVFVGFFTPHVHSVSSYLHIYFSFEITVINCAGKNYNGCPLNRQQYTLQWVFFILT